ncbi:predicted nucleic acid-binding protein [Cereibacter ovatus]|uniref:Predicted nucleic acid-binding protein n=1 Tax=Cereibacter ovatus TaxID=439529 RepID=A0A285CJ41_9RHOB|nr:PIN domain-containing protein [Cereibacter ovatus]SNX67612.1 predicted nucleic acid-binding protein [Cereibacter ovatus]
MKVVLDACVLFPTVLREILLGVAARGLYTPLWSDRILEEWARATRRLGPLAEAQARAEGAAARDAFPQAMVPPQPGLQSRLHLPDEDDIHVLATAIAGHADAIVTFNAADFPRGVLAAEGVARRDPDGFLWEVWSFHPDTVEAAVAEVHARAESIAGQPLVRRALLKRAGLPRLAKALQG